MSKYSTTDELFQGIACIWNAQDLLERGEPRGKVMEHLNESLEAMGCFVSEMEKQGLV